MNIALGSIFRNAVSYIPRYVDQVVGMRDALHARGDRLRLVLAEGDSTDATAAALRDANSWQDWKRFPERVDIFEKSHGGPVFGSVFSLQRHRQMSLVWQAVHDRLDAADDVFIYVESDLIWKPEMLLRLIDRLGPGADMVAPLPWYLPEDRFYDTWAFRGPDGANFGRWWPFHSMFLDPSPNGGMYPLSRAGSCLVMKGEVARTARYDPADMCIVGFCENAVDRGYKIWVDPQERVFHA